MAFFRINKEEKFTQIDNRMINDKTISAKAKGILIYLLSKPSDWKVYEVDIVNNMKDGRDSIRSGISELIENGYIERELASGEKGKFAGYNYNVYEHNSENPCWKNRDGKPDVGKTDNGKPDNGKPDTSNTKVTNTDLTNTNINKTEEKKDISSSLIDNSFLELKDYYELKIAKTNFTTDQKLDDLLDEFNDSKLIIEAMQVALAKDKNPLSYSKGILKNWRDEHGITSYEQLAAQKENRHGKNQNGTTKQYDDGVNF